MFGPSESTVDGITPLYQFDFDNKGSINGMLPSLTTSSRQRRQAASQYQFISNPSLCILVGEMVIFNIDIDEDNRANSSYPRYQPNNVYNTAPDFDYGDFRILEDRVLNSVDVTFDKFAFVFTDEGNYVFESSIDQRNVLFVHVASDGTRCSSFGIRPQNEFELSQMGIIEIADLNTPPNAAIIVSVISGVILLILGLMIFTFIWIPRDRSFSALNNWRPKYLALDAPFIPPSLTAKESVYIHFENYKHNHLKVQSQKKKYSYKLMRLYIFF